MSDVGDSFKLSSVTQKLLQRRRRRRGCTQSQSKVSKNNRWFKAQIFLSIPFKGDSTRFRSATIFRRLIIKRTNFCESSKNWIWRNVLNRSDNFWWKHTTIRFSRSCFFSPKLVCTIRRDVSDQKKGSDYFFRRNCAKVGQKSIETLILVLANFAEVCPLVNSRGHWVSVATGVKTKTDTKESHRGPSGQKDRETAPTLVSRPFHCGRAKRNRRAIARARNLMRARVSKGLKSAGNYECRDTFKLPKNPE